jgi:hypothetical protein
MTLSKQGAIEHQHRSALQAAGVTSLAGIAAALNERRIPTASGRGTWQSVQVSRALAWIGMQHETPAVYVASPAFSLLSVRSS